VNRRLAAVPRRNKRKLPGITPEDYGKLVMQVISHGGQHQPHDCAVKDQGHGHGAVPPGAPKDHSMNGTGEGTPEKLD